MEDLVRYLIESLVDRPEEVKLVSKTEGDTETITVCVGKGDTGKIIGKQGRIAIAVRTVVKAAASKQNKRCNVEIVDSLED